MCCIELDNENNYQFITKYVIDNCLIKNKNNFQIKTNKQ